MSLAAVHKHVAVLEATERVNKRRRGPPRLVSGNVRAVRETSRLLDRSKRCGEAASNAFADILTEDQVEEPHEPATPLVA